MRKTAFSDTRTRIETTLSQGFSLQVRCFPILLLSFNHLSKMGDPVFQILGTEKQSLQLILAPGEKIVTDTESICWCSSNSIQMNNKGLMDPQLGDAMNEGISPAVVCLANAECGKVLVIQMTRVPPLPPPGGDLKGIYCFKHAFLCTTDDVIVESKMLPLELSYMSIFLPHLFNKAIYIDGNNSQGKIFLQSGGEIFTKELKRNDTMLVKFGCMVAFDASVKISVVSPFHYGVFCLPGLGGREPFVLLSGPGNVYFCADTTLRKAALTSRARLSVNTALQSNVSMIGFAFYFVFVLFSFFTLSLLLNRVAVEFEQQIDGANILHRF